MLRRISPLSRPLGTAFALGAVLAAGGILLEPTRSQPAGAPQPVPVGTVPAERKPVSRTTEFIGRVEAIDRVQVRARVTGYLEAILFKEGGTIGENAPVYRLEKGQFEAAVKQAEGALERARAAKVLTAVQLARAEDLFKRGSGSEVARDQALAADQQAAGAILEAEAQLQTAKINLGYTDITSPIAGKIGRTSVTKGNVVGPDTGALTTIVSEDPMYVTFPVSQRDFLRAQQTGNRPNLQNLKVRLRYADGTQYSETGTLHFVDVSVDRGTDTVTVRATVPNPKGGLIDGQLMRVVVEADKPQEKVVIPQAALIADQGGVYIFVVQEGKAVVKRVTPGAGQGAGVVIEQGLNGGELIIVQGLHLLRPGAPVRAVPVARTPGQD